MVIPSRHPRGGMTNKWLTWTLFLLYTSSTLSTASSTVDGSIIASGSDPPIPASSASPQTQAGRSPAEIPPLTHNVPKFRNTNEDAGQYDHALAPASLQPAVRAPTTKSTESQALSQPNGARRLVDWEADDLILLSTIDGALHARDRKSGRKRWELKMPEPMIRTVHHAHNRSNLDELQIQDDYIFIVEPSKDGQLYAQFANPRVGLIKLPATVKKMATEVPFSMNLNGHWLATTSQQESKAYTIDAQTGEVLHEFPRSKSPITSVPQPRCRPRSGLDFEDSACRPGRTLRLGRNTYTFTISNEETMQDLCTIRFSEWVTNKVDHDLQSQHSTALDSYDIRVGRNGWFFGVDVTAEQPDRQHRYHYMLDSPVARVYDVARKLDEEDDSTDLVLLSRSHDYISSDDVALLKQDAAVNQRVFLNRTTEGQWYALSEQNYPGVTTRAAVANVQNSWFTEPLDLHGDLTDIVGVHLLSQNPPVSQQLTIGERAFNQNSKELISEPGEAVASHEELEKGLDRIVTSWSGWLNRSLTSVLLLLLGAVAYWGVMHPQYWKGFRSKVPVSDIDRDTTHTTARPVTPVPLIGATTIAAQTTGPRPLEPGFVMVEQNSNTPAHSRVQSTASAQSPRKEDDDNASDDESDGETEIQDNETAPEKKRKKTKRGNRGGRGRRKNKGDPTSFETKPVVLTETHLKDGTVRIGRLLFDGNLDNCLGSGSSGTTVHPGSFDGRAVAVKRLVKSANSLAEKEIRHLISSDENPNVIRYHGKEESHNFFYIALDLFDTSLDQFVEFPDKFPHLVSPTSGYDVKDALQQITRGVQHLHSLKLVHRDIKPQNVLVRPVKTNRPVAGLTPLLFVISDFGLCKPLDDRMGSAFAATRTAAGTTGWKAPELLVSAKDAIAAPEASMSSTPPHSQSHTASSSVSDNETVIDPPTGRRATKAIDIFSLGCVFFYVLTRGAHPFDRGGSNIARELNIIENRYDTSLLRESFVGYDYDADDLIMQMIMHDPKARPDTAGVLHHPYFWKIVDKLDFLCAVSDNYEERKQKVTNIHDEDTVRSDSDNAILDELAALQAKAPNVIGVKKDGQLQSFLDALPRSFLTEMGKQRKYTGTKMIDLLRVIRNKKNHFHDLPNEVKEMMMRSASALAVGENARCQIEGYYAFWRDRFPSLLVNCHQLLQERNLVEEFGLQRFYDGSM